MNCFQILYIRSLNTILLTGLRSVISCELLSDFVYSFFEHNHTRRISFNWWVVNCFQILYIRSLNTISATKRVTLPMLWIAFRFCIFVLWTQFLLTGLRSVTSCELLSDFVYSFFEHNQYPYWRRRQFVVNCFQILYIRSLNTIAPKQVQRTHLLWIAFRFCIFVLWTQSVQVPNRSNLRCELLSDFVYSFFEHNKLPIGEILITVVNCFQILYIRSLNTIPP